MARLRQFRCAGPSALKALENAELSWRCHVREGRFDRPAAGWAEPEASEFAHCPNFAADFAGGAAVAVSGDAVLSRRPSGLDADGLALAQGRAGVAAMDRFQGDFAGAAALGGGLRGRQILQPSRRRLGRAAGCDRRSRRTARCRAAARPSPSRWRRTCSCGRAAAWSARALELPLAMWIDLVLPKQRILEIYLNIAELGPSGQFGAEAGSPYAFGRSASTLSPREAALLAAILPNPVRRSARNPGPGVRRLAGTYMARAQCLRVAAVLERKSCILSQFSADLTLESLALRHPFLYKRGLIGIAARALKRRAVRYRTMPSDNTPRGPLWPFPEEKHRPRGVACAARRTR